MELPCVRVTEVRLNHRLLLSYVWTWAGVAPQQASKLAQVTPSLSASHSLLPATECLCRCCQCWPAALRGPLLAAPGGLSCVHSSCRAWE